MGNHVLTGANGGIGRATARELEQRNQRVIRVVRSSTGRDSFAADLSVMSNVNRLADEIASNHDSLDGLLLNAGIASAGTGFTPEGFETTFAVNHLGAFLLAHRLLPLLQRSPHGRIVLTGSSDHMSVQEASVAALARGEDPGYTATYARSKAIAMAAIMEMAHRLMPEDWDPEAERDDQSRFVRVNVADPGWTRTGLTSNAPRAIRLLVTLGRPFQNRLTHSARVLADLATETDKTGTYTGIKSELTPSALLRDTSFRRAAYEDSAELLIERGLAGEPDFLPPR